MKRKTFLQQFGKKIYFISALGFFVTPIQANSTAIMNYDTVTELYSVESEQCSIKEVIDYIEKNSQWIFAYDQRVKKILDEKISMSVTNKKPADLLSELCNKAGLNYKIAGRQVTITIKNAPSKANAKKRIISGNVVDTQGEPLIGATIQEKGSKGGTITDVDGNFTLEVSDNAKLIVSYVGQTTQTIDVKGASKYKITMQEDSHTLEETVVIGYGTVKKKDLTGSVAAVKGEELMKKRTTMLSSALEGVLSGVMVRRSSSAPGSGASDIHVRGVTTIGDSSPLVIVDGVQSSLDYVNANDVESISVLKDAAAASIYGSKAAAGVILVTTKRGNDSGKLVMNYTGEFGWEIPTKQPSMVGVTRYLEMNNELLYNDNPSGGFFRSEERRVGKEC